MKVLSATLAAGLLVVSNGIFAEDALVATEADIIEDDYIATANVDPATCDELRKSVDKAKVDTDGMQRSMLDGPAGESTIGMACFIYFKGSSNVKRVVEAMPGVEAVENNRMVVSTAVESWGLDRVDQPDLPLDDSFTSFYDGTGVNVYIVDTGINKDHVDFGSRSEFGAEFVNEGTRADQNGHGTHCAGTAAGSTYGVARGATIYGVKVLSGRGSGSNQGVIRGVEWAADHAVAAGKPGVLSMSLGGGRSTATNNAVNAAFAKGVMVVVAAGNENTNACNRSPASAGGQGTVITVASSTITDSRSSFSNYGDCVDIFAPGSDITSAWIGSSTATRTISGTSMATPHVAGIAATYLQKYKGDVKDAMAAMLADAAAGKISGANGSPNKLAQVPKQGEVGDDDDDDDTGDDDDDNESTPAPTPEPTTPPPSCWWCWWLDSAETGAQSPAPAPAPAPEVVAAPAVDNSSDVLTAAVISGSTVAFVALAAGMVVYKRNKSRESAVGGATLEDQL